jgi:hypothetical protein
MLGQGFQRAEIQGLCFRFFISDSAGARAHFCWLYILSCFPSTRGATVIDDDSENCWALWGSKANKITSSKLKTKTRYRAKIFIWAGCRWLTPVITATQETESKKIVVWSQPGQIALKTLSWKNPAPKKGKWSSSRYGPWVQILVPSKKIFSILGLAEWLKWYSANPASMRSWGQTPLSPKKKNSFVATLIVEARGIWPWRQYSENRKPTLQSKCTYE